MSFGKKLLKSHLWSFVTISFIVDCCISMSMPLGDIVAVAAQGREEPFGIIAIDYVAGPVSERIMEGGIVTNLVQFKV
jgi:hypothetical protein